jgi:hypothetical protein
MSQQMKKKKAQDDHWLKELLWSCKKWYTAKPPDTSEK